MLIGHADLVALDGVGDGHRRMINLRRGQGAQVGGDGCVEVGVVGTAQGCGVLELPRGPLQGEAGAGAADVGNQAGAVMSAHLMRPEGAVGKCWRGNLTTRPT